MSKIKLYLALFISLLFSELCSAIEPILVTENTFKLNGEETLYYGFAAGDQIIFDFKEANGKAVKEIEIVEMPSNTKFQDFKTTEISDKKIKVDNNGLYAFRFKNPIMAGRVCKIKIQRVPADESKISFDTGWHYENVNDTTFIPYTEDSLTGYVDEKYIETVRELVDTKQNFNQIFNTDIEIHSKGHISLAGGNKNYKEITLDLPYERTKYYEKKVTAWVLWYCPSNKAPSFWQKNKVAIKKTLEEVVQKTPYGELGAYAAGYVTELIIPDSGDYSNRTLDYYVMTPQNCNNFKNGLNSVYLHKASGISGYNRFTSPEMTRNGKLCLVLCNNNSVHKVNINLKVGALIEENTYQDVDYERVRQVPQYVTLHKNKYKIKTTKVVRMNGK